jgi:hypothetical protein
VKFFKRSADAVADSEREINIELVEPETVDVMLICAVKTHVHMKSTHYSDIYLTDDSVL